MSSSKFWGLTVNVGKKFKQQVQEPFCISGAALEPLEVNSGKFDEKPVFLYLQQDQNDYLLCSLSPKQSVLQAGLNVRIGSGETVGFHLKGGSQKSKVHLTGYTLPRDGTSSTATSPGSGVPFKGQQRSILVTEPKSVDKQKKRVSIVETEAYGEREELESDEETGGSATKRLFLNGTLDLDEEDEDDDDDDDEDDDEDENSDSDLNDDEIKELQQFVQKGKYDPKTGGRLGEDEDEDSDLEMMDEEEDDDDDDDDDDLDEDGVDSDDDEEEGASKKKKQQKDQKSPDSKSPNKPQKLADNRAPQKKQNDLNNVNKPSEPKTPENKHLNLGKTVQTPSSAGSTPLKSFSKGGVLVNEIKVGNGAIAKPGKVVTVYYDGRLKSNNKRFDSSQNGPGFKFRLGKGEVIRGWDLGLEGMKVGGKRRLVVPAQLAYGKRGAPPDIPPNSTLVFEVQLNNVS